MRALVLFPILISLGAGAQASETIVGNTGRFQYTGQVLLSELGSATCPGVYYYKARMYSACLGRFLQTDPVGYKSQINLYAYVGDDPVNANDPTGYYGDCTGSRLCDDVNDAISAARQTLMKSISTLTSLRNKEASGAKLNDSENSAGRMIDKYLGQGVSKSVEKLNSIIGVASRELSVINDRSLNKYSFDRATTPVANRIPYAGIIFHAPFFDQSPRDIATTIANEAWHEATRLPDLANYGGRQLAAERATEWGGNFGHLMEFHDNVNYALGF